MVGINLLQWCNTQQCTMNGRDCKTHVCVCVCVCVCVLCVCVCAVCVCVCVYVCVCVCVCGACVHVLQQYNNKRIKLHVRTMLC